LKQQYIHNTIAKYIIAFLVLIILASTSCNYAKHIPSNKTLLWQNRIIVKGNFKSDDNIELLNQLLAGVEQVPNTTLLGLDIETGNIGYYMPRPKLWYYNIDARRVQKGKDSVFFKNKIFQLPVIYDDNKTTISKKRLQAICFNNGFYYAKIKDSIITKKGKKTCAYYVIDIGKNYFINDIKYISNDTTILGIIKQNEGASFLKKGAPSSRTKIALERERLSSLIVENGYFNFRQNAIQVTEDTADKEIIANFNNPFEIFNIITDTNRAKKISTVDIIFKISDSINNEKIKQFFINQIKLDMVDKLSNKSSVYAVKEYNNILFGNYIGNVKPQYVAENIFFKKGEMFNSKKIDATLNRLKSLNAFQSIKIDYTPSDSDKINTNITATMNKRLKIIFDAEGSQGQNYGLGFDVKGGVRFNNFLYTASLLNLLGNVGLRYNTYRTSSWLPRFEFWQLAYGINVEAKTPRLILPSFLKWNNPKKKPFTSIGLSFNVYDRPVAFTQTTARGIISYSWQQNKFVSWKVSPVFLTLVNTTDISDSTQARMAQNPFFKQQLIPYTILGSAVNFEYNNLRPNLNLNYYIFRVNIDKAGTILYNITNNEDFRENVARYLKVETELKHYTVNKKSIWVNRAYVNAGIPIQATTLPYILQQNIGGPFSLRGWRVFDLGPGAKLDTSTNTNQRITNTGDIKVELNSELRKPLFKLFSGVMKIEGAAFLDAGNIWRYKDTSNNSQAQFKWSKLYTDLAVNTGVGLRFDLTLLKVRLDWGFPIKQPYLGSANEWGFRNPNQAYAFNPIKWFGRNSWWGANSTIQFGINYPF
jgi:outer membrane protein insertion porin family